MCASKTPKIETGISYPNSDLPVNLPLSTMKIGESFTLTLTDPRRQKGTVRGRLSRFQYANKPKRFRIKAVELNVIRIYRVEDYEL